MGIQNHNLKHLNEKIKIRYSKFTDVEMCDTLIDFRHIIISK